MLFICKIEDFNSKNIHFDNNSKIIDNTKSENNQINNNINLLDIDSIDEPSNINNNNNNFNNNNALLNKNADVHYDLLDFSNDPFADFNCNNQNNFMQSNNFINNNMNNNSNNFNAYLQTGQAGNFNIEEVNKNVEIFKKNEKSNDPFNFVDELMKKK